MKRKSYVQMFVDRFFGWNLAFYKIPKYDVTNKWLTLNKVCGSKMFREKNDVLDC